MFFENFIQYLLAYSAVILAHELGHLIVMRTQDDRAEIRIDKKGIRTVGLVDDRVLYYSAANGIFVGWFVILALIPYLTPLVFISLCASYLWGIRGDVKVMKKLKKTRGFK